VGGGGGGGDLRGRGYTHEEGTQEGAHKLLIIILKKKGGFKVSPNEISCVERRNKTRKSNGKGNHTKKEQ